ncbi:hypothetical protein PSACC_00134 [Paramicrosporidium saccamoebae]|uniref:Endonuclease/exonuclease/phosphatase domain-containing protein n=1 Tax=Paramicrosporidium saccamoebae TaxID=1246581 RepID=A0A2H9TQM4_9FUNG|nr:hypothetical protein PSACC_00134 [Paramicrosporidium saccamoebae]
MMQHQLLLVLLLASALSDCPTRGFPPLLPPKYSDGAPSRTTYHKRLQKYFPHVNPRIPRMGRDVVRVVTHNANYQRDLWKTGDNRKRIKADLEVLQASVVVLREVPKPAEAYLSKTGDVESRNEIVKPTGPLWDVLKALEYGDFHFGSCMKASFGTLIASRIPFKHVDFMKLDAIHGITFVSLLFGRHHVGLFDAKIANDIHDLIVRSYIKEKIKLYKLDYYIVAAEMPGKVRLPIIPFRSAFDALGWPHPAFTSWRDMESDHIFVAKNAEVHLLGAYLYLSFASDHLPVLADFCVPGAEPVTHFHRFPKGTLLLGIFAVLFLTLITGFGMYYWIRSKLDPL